MKNRMDMVLTVERLARLIELKKKVAELEYKKNFLSRKSPELAKEVEEDIGVVKEEMRRLLDQMTGTTIYVPFERKIETLNEKLGTFSFEEIDAALRTKRGPAYEFLKEKADFVNRNLRMRMEIGKLNIVLQHLPSSLRERIGECIKNGEIREIIFKNAQRKYTERIARCLSRVGIPTKIVGDRIVSSEKNETDEEAVDIDGITIYIDKTRACVLKENQHQLEQVTKKIQAKNAERTIRKFEDEEEKEYQELQKQYLELYTKKKEMLDEVAVEELSLT